MTTPRPRPGILDIAPYVPGASKASGGTKTYKLSSNESALGASERAMAAYCAAAKDLFLYPDGSARALRSAIAELHELQAENIVCGAGSDELLQLVAKAYLGEGDNIVQSAHGFLVYSLAAQSCGADTIFAPEKELTVDVDAMLDAVTPKTRIVFLANPNNPTGTYVPDHELRRLRQNLRDDVLLVIDSAYAEYMDAADYAAGDKLVEENDNVVMTRTFSKIYGLGGLRIGWAYCPPAIADVLNRIRGPFNISSSAIAAGVAAISDQEFVERNRVFNKEHRDMVSRALGGMGLAVVPSVANFVLVKFPDDASQGADAMRKYLADNGVMVREMSAYRLPGYLRISIGTQEANARLIELLEQKFGR